MNLKERLELIIAEGESVIQTHRPNPSGIGSAPTLDIGRYAAWIARSKATLLEVEKGSNSIYTTSFINCTGDRAVLYRARSGVQVLRTVLDELEKGHLEPTNISISADTILDSLCNRFHLVARQLRDRYSDRETLDISDEYDVQDLMHALLHLNFDDIRSEDWAPSYAGGASRVDFLLKNERTVIEVKKTRHGLNARKLGEELIIDIDRYKAHPSCDQLICFVYDPEGRISNPRGLEADLSRDEPLRVRVFIRPL